MNKIEVLDCTLRDGGRVIDCLFSNEQIQNISSALSRSNIQIIELGFLDTTKNITQSSTYFTDIHQLEPYVKPNNQYSVFVNFGRYDFPKLAKYNEKLPQIIRIGFTQEDFIKEPAKLKEVFNLVKNLGYTVFMQALNTHTYSEDQFCKLINLANEIQPHSFAIVDSFGSMLPLDLEKYFNFAQKNLNPQIKINFHSHNNIQLSFAHALWLLEQKTNRDLIIDSTLYGMGRGGGNLHTELICEYLNKQFKTNYNIQEIISIIETEILPIQKQHNWGHSIPAFLGGIHEVHPHNIYEYYENKYKS